MRVLVLTNMYPSPENPTYGIFVREQVEDLQGLGVHVDVLAIAGHRSRLNYARAALDLRRKLRSRRFDLVHAHYGLSGAVALGQIRVPLVTTFHGSDAYIWWQRIISYVVARRATPIFVSESCARALGFAAGTILPAGVNTAAFTPIPRSEARSALGWDETRPYVLFPGARNVSIKRFDLFEQVVGLTRQEIPNLEAVCLEDFERPVVPVVMNAVNATLLTSDDEGSPVTVRESLACLTPVVSVAVGDVPEVIARLPGCSVGTREPTDLAERLLAALSSPRSQALRDRAEDYSRQKIAERLLAVYEDTLKRRARIK